MLDEQVPPASKSDMPRLPRERYLKQRFPAESINLLQFLEIRDCELGHLVAERNSVLGRVAVPSQRLVYDINFLRTGEACIKLVGKAHPELAATITKEMAVKQRQLPNVIWQAILGGPEFRKFWRFGGSPLPAIMPSQADVLLAIRQLDQDAERWLNGDYRVDESRFEHQLDVIRGGDGGLQLRAWETLEGKFDAADAILAAREARRPLCFPGMHPPAANIFGNVVQEMLIQGIQPWVAQLNRQYYSLFPAVRSLEKVLAPGEPPAYRVWRHARGVALEHATHALLRHVDRLQPLLAQCNLLPQVR